MTALFNLSAFAQICPSGDMVILCHKNPSVRAISLTGCYNGGLAYLCTSQISTCEIANSVAIQKARWTLPVYEPKAMRFICPGEGRETTAKRLKISADIWKKVAAKAIAEHNRSICPSRDLPVLCHQQSTGVSLIGCYEAGLAYLCTKTISSCSRVNNETISKAPWIHANYNDSKLIFDCPGTQTKRGHKHIILHTDTWNTTIRNAK